MTTVAYKDGVLAADSLVTDCNGMRVENKDKITEIVRGPENEVTGAFAGCGGATVLLKLKNHIMQNGLHGLDELSLKGENFEALILHKSGALYYIDRELVPEQINEPRYAIGSGAPFALAAMHCGKSAVEAVKVACVFDTNSGGDVKSWEM